MYVVEKYNYLLIIILIKKFVFKLNIQFINLNIKLIKNAYQKVVIKN